MKEKESHTYIGFVLIIAFGVIVYGVLKLNWHMYEIGAIFFIVAFVSGLIDRMSLDDITNEFIKGAQSVLLAALVVGMARGILIIVESGGIIDTVILGFFWH